MTPHTLAAVDGSWIFALVLMAAGAIINWLGEKRKKEAEKKAQREGGLPPAEAAQPIPEAPSEQERLRRFLEALGLPPEAAPPQQEPPPAARPRPRAQETPPPLAPRPVSVPRPAQTPSRFPQPPPVEARRPRVPRVIQQETTYSEGPSAPVATPPAQTGLSVADQFAAMSSGVTLTAMAAPAEPSHSTAFDLERAPRPSQRQAAAIHEALRDPGELRRAFILREILGPPPGLQS